MQSEELGEFNNLQIAKTMVVWDHKQLLLFCIINYLCKGKIRNTSQQLDGRRSSFYKLQRDLIKIF